MMRNARRWLAGLAAIAFPVLGWTATLPVNEYHSFQVTTSGFTNRYIRHANGLGYTEVVSDGSSALLKDDATFRIVPGLGNGACYSFESKNFPGHFLRHANWRVRKDARDGSVLFDHDATWCVRGGLSGTGVSLEAMDFPGAFLRHRNGELWLDYNNGGPFNADASWNVTGAWSGGGSGCNAVDWQRGVNYGLGTVVRYNGQYYKLVNVGANGSDGTDPTISTWYWQPTTCGGGDNNNNNGSFPVSEAQYNQMFPSRNGLYTYSALVNAAAAFPGFLTTGSDTVRKQEIAAFFANIAHESDQLRATREYNTANWPLYCDTNWGNTCAPGQQYYGRGPMQLSWNYNYKSAGDALGVNLWANPDLVATDSVISWKTAVWYWMTGTGSAGITPHAAMVNGNGFGTTILAINGGLECNGNGAAQCQARINYYTSFTQLLGVPTGPNLGC